MKYLQMLVWILGYEILTSQPHLTASKTTEQMLLEHMSKTWKTGRWLDTANMASTRPSCAWLILWPSTMERARQVVINYRDFCKAMDTVPHILDTTLQIFEFDRWIPIWIRSWLDCHIQTVSIAQYLSGNQ